MSYPVLETGYKSPTSVFETSTTQQHAIGARGILMDRVFRYARTISQSAIGPNLLAQTALVITNHRSQTGTQVGTTSSASVNIQLTLGNTVAGEDYYKDGYLNFEQATNGKGCIHHIKSNSYAAGGAVMDAILWDLPTTLTTGSEVWSLYPNPWGVVSIGAATSPAAGVPLVNWTACTTALVSTPGYLQTGAAEWTLPQYGWLQTWGMCSVGLDASSTVINTGVIATTSGQVTVETTATIIQRVGIAMSTLGQASDNDYNMIFLTIAP